VLAVIAFNLLRAAGALASQFHATATTSTLRAQLISIPARITTSARRIRLRLPANWPWQHAWQTLLAVALTQPAAS
jgi:Transposase DDE domain group 1